MNFLRFIGRFIKKTYKIIISAAYYFWMDDCYARASILTFYTLQSIVPLFAFAIGLGQGFGFNQYLETLIVKGFYQQREVMQHAIEIAHSMLAHLKGNMMIGFGILFLLWTNLNLFSYIESALNHIWKIQTERPLLRKVTDYLAIIIITPIFFVISASLTFYAKTELIHIKEYTGLAAIPDFFLFVLSLSPWVLSWIVFFLLYWIMPNGRLKIWPRVVAAIIAGSGYQFWQIIYINFMINIFSYNVVYGTVAALPFFLLWLQFSWLIVLAGAEISAQMEEIVTFGINEFEGKVQQINRKELSLLILHQYIQNYYTCKPTLNDIQLSKFLKIPIETIQETMQGLVEGDVLAKSKVKENVHEYYLLCDPKCHTVKEICDIVDKKYQKTILVESNEQISKISELLGEIDRTREESEANITLDRFFGVSTPENA